MGSPIGTSDSKVDFILSGVVDFSGLDEAGFTMVLQEVFESLKRIMKKIGTDSIEQRVEVSSGADDRKPKEHGVQIWRAETADGSDEYFFLTSKGQLLKILVKEHLLGISVNMPVKYLGHWKTGSIADLIQAMRTEEEILANEEGREVYFDLDTFLVRILRLVSYEIKDLRQKELDRLKLLDDELGHIAGFHLRAMKSSILQDDQIDLVN